MSFRTVTGGSHECRALDARFSSLIRQPMEGFGNDDTLNQLIGDEAAIVIRPTEASIVSDIYGETPLTGESMPYYRTADAYAKALKPQKGKKPKPSSPS